ncbi:hypothetical protein D3C78_1644200 [compost metagenome]
MLTISDRYAPVFCTKVWNRNTVGPTISTNSSSTTASTRLVSDRMRMPLSSPLATDIVASPQVMMIRMICVVTPTGTPNK